MPLAVVMKPTEGKSSDQAALKLVQKFAAWVEQEEIALTRVGRENPAESITTMTMLEWLSVNMPSGMETRVPLTNAPKV